MPGITKRNINREISKSSQTDRRKSERIRKNMVVVTFYDAFKTCTDKTSRAVKEVRVECFFLVQISLDKVNGC